MISNPAPQLSPLAPHSTSRHRYVVVAILFIALLVSYLDRVNVNVLIANDAFLSDFGIAGDPIRMGMLLSTFQFAYGVSNVVFAPLGKHWGPRRVVMLAIAIWIASTAIGGLAGSFGFLILARIVLGIGEGMHWPMQSLFVANWFPAHERSRANAAWLLGLMIGPLVATPVIALLISAYGWRFSFWALSALALVPLGLVWLFISDHPSQSKFVSPTELAIIESADENAANEPSELLLTPVGMAFLFDFRYWLLVASLLSSLCMFWGTMAWLPSYLKTVRHFTFEQSAWLAALPFLFGTLTLLLGGYVADFVKRKSILIVVALLGTASCIYWGTRAENGTIAAIILAATVGFSGFGLSSYWTILQRLVARAVVGAAAGTMNGFAQIGSALTPILVGWWIGHTGSYQSGLSILVGIGAMGAFCATLLAFKRL